ncbi:YheC/YheD family protein [Paenactinomyces guangxiensis]|uniref:YheC/YheD family protein n=1 Tax=Paenactinomyces guangxiensis TaxID=1490290 RepID=A0A7W1WSG9_9BACL|nr:YheC/YheD family protein [Paenactinomyces guangxiensis]MBA4495250.1 YheC/YheD family protein [Paenactinomyces guangxiensis]MBH8592334.1 YheC/YheD family protein [Paenactinomyces guangxiensis]
MSSIICQTQLNAKTPAKAIILSQPLMEQWGCANGQSIKVEIGNKSLITRVVRIKSKKNWIIFSPNMARQLHLPYAGLTRTTFYNKRLKLGPVIGILTTGYTGNPSSPFGSRSLLFRNFIQAGASEKPFIYVFTPEMVDWQNKTVSGWYFKTDASGGMRWFRRTSPFPDVVYERVPNRKAESLSYVQACLTRLKEMSHCQIFNQGFFNKWSVHLWLSNHPVTSSFTPETYLSPSIQTLQKMLEKHQMVYLKPSGGSLGLGIFRITRHPKEGYFCRFHQGAKNVLHRFYSLEKLIKYYFGSNHSGRFKKYLVQQGIRLIKHENRPVDFRVHMHKDGSDQWKVVAIGSKAAGSGSVTTHVRTGGFVIPTDVLLKKVFKENAKNVEESIKSTAILIAKVLEQQVNGPLGELGMDMGVDRNGHVWLFEINAKPGRHIFLHPSLREAGRQSAKYITDYSMKLANFI